MKARIAGYVSATVGISDSPNAFGWNQPERLEPSMRRKSRSDVPIGRPRLEMMYSTNPSVWAIAQGSPPAARIGIVRTRPKANERAAAYPAHRLLRPRTRCHHD